MAFTGTAADRLGISFGAAALTFPLVLLQYSGGHFGAGTGGLANDGT